MGQKSRKWRYSFLFPTFFRKHVWQYLCPPMNIALLSYSSSHWAQTLPPSLHQPYGCDSFPLSPFSWPHCPGMAQPQHLCRICFFIMGIWVGWQQRFSPPPPPPHSFGNIRQIFISSFIHLLTHSYISIVQGTTVDPEAGIRPITQALYIMSLCVSLSSPPSPSQHLGNITVSVVLCSRSLPFFTDTPYLTLLTLML